MKAFRAVNFFSGSSVSGEKLRRHRAAMERAGKITLAHQNVVVRQFTVNGMNCEALRPEYAHDPRYAVLHIHGGGYVCGGLSYAGILAGKTAEATGFTTYTFDYALAPENPYPAALDDAMVVWDHLSTNGYAPDHIFISGESAGGNLALCLVRKLIGQKKSLPCGLLLFSPWTDMTGSAPSYEANAEIDPILTKEYVQNAAKVYIADNGTPDDERFSPLFGSFDGFPPVYIMAGKNEILLDDSVRLHEAIRRDNGVAELDIEEAGWHVYQQMPVPVAARAMKRLAAYVSERIYGKDKWQTITGQD